MTDEALEFLREDQRKSGLTVREYESKYGVILGLDAARPVGKAADIRKHEVSLEADSDRQGARPHCAACAGPPPNEGGP